ncbi:MAG: bifunctional alpha/beta hydrolase/class I SAM-dependent methyltransferase [Pseudomonadota bacterium]
MNAHTTEIAPHPSHPPENWVQCHDGTHLFYRRWKADRPQTGAVVLLHRGHEHGGRMEHLIDEGLFAGFDVYAWDARGHGWSDGERGAAPHVGELVRDLDAFVRHISDHNGIPVQDIAIVAQSVGAVIAATWVHDYAPPIRGMVLAAPAFEVNLQVPLARTVLDLWLKVRGDYTVQSYVQPSMLTQDADRAKSYATDPLITPTISANVLMDLHETAKRVVADAPAITVPTQILIAGSDSVVKKPPQDRFFNKLGANFKDRHVYPDLRHDILGERDRGQVMTDIKRFLTQCFNRTIDAPALQNADRRGYTKAEADRLAAPAGPLQSVVWAAMRGIIRLGGKLSEGIRLGHEAGFDSGSMLDYVYRNKATGAGPIGRWIDRIYLNSPGWRGIRQRRRNIEELTAIALRRLAAQGQPARMTDIAAGHGRYLLEAIAASDQRPESILLRDYCERNVAHGQELIKKLDLAGIARFEQGNAFDGDSIAAVDPRPTLAIVSGLYELFSDNGLISGSLDGLARAVPEGGLLIYTGQPWHPQLEMIARTLTSHRDGQPWVMRRRTQAEMDALVAQAGFRKIEQRIDRWGIFTVSLAVRVAD